MTIANMNTGQFIAFNPDTGKPLVGGKVYFFEPSTTTPKATYTNRAGSAQNTHPVILDDVGAARIWLDGAYDVRIDDANDVTVSTLESVYGALDEASVAQAISEAAAGVAIDYGSISVTSDITLSTTAASKMILIDASAGDITITLPAAAGMAGKAPLTLRRTDASANTVTIDGSGSETIDGAATLNLLQRHTSEIRSDGSAWFQTSRDLSFSLAVTDWDDAIYNGFYYSPSGATNAPADLSGSAICGIVSKQGDDDLVQVVVGQSITRMYWRLRNGGTWGSWERAMRFSDVLDEDDFASDDPEKPPSQQSVGAYIAARILDEDDFSSDDPEKAPSQQSTKAYVKEDIAKVIAFGSVSDGNFTVAFDEGCTITRAGTGDYTVTFDSAEPDTDYAVVATLLTSSGGEEVLWVAPKTTTSFNINIFFAGGGAVNRPFDVVVYRLRS